MIATVEIDELNGGGIVTHGVVNLNVGNVDQPNIVVSPTTALKPGTNAFVKLNRLHFLDLGDAIRVSTIRIWVTGQFRTGESMRCNLPRPDYDSYYSTSANEIPTQNSYDFYIIPKSEPKVAEVPRANLGIGGSLEGVLTEPGYSDIFKWQLQTAATLAPGALHTKQFNFAWKEEYSTGAVPSASGTPVFSNITGTTITLTWTAATNAATYEIQRALSDPLGSYAYVAGSDTASTVISDTVPAAGTYWYRLRAVNTHGVGPWTPPVGLAFTG